MLTKYLLQLELLPGIADGLPCRFLLLLLNLLPCVWQRTRWNATRNFSRNSKVPAAATSCLPCASLRGRIWTLRGPFRSGGWQRTARFGREGRMEGWRGREREGGGGREEGRTLLRKEVALNPPFFQRRAGMWEQWGVFSLLLQVFTPIFVIYVFVSCTRVDSEKHR